MRKGRCVKWSKGRTKCMKRAKSTSKKRGRKGRRPANKGKKCKRFGRSSTGRRVCRKY